MNGSPAQRQWDAILLTTPTTLSERLRYKLAQKAHQEQANYVTIGEATGLRRQTIENFAKRVHHSRADTLDAIYKWVGGL